VPSFKLGVVVLAHHEPDQLATLLATLRHPQLHSYVHLDVNADQSQFRETIDRAATDAVTWLPRRRSRWGGIEVVDASLDGLAHALDDGCSYVILISGQDFPLRPAGQLVSFAESAGDVSYVEFWPIPTDRWRYDGRDRTDFYTFTVLGRRETCIPSGEDMSTFSAKGRLLNSALRVRTVPMPKRRTPSYVRPFGGSQWWNLSLGAGRHVLDFCARHPDFRGYHVHTLAPDEVLIHSALLGGGYDAADRVVNDDLRFMTWTPGAYHPHTLTLADLPEISRASASDLFARKVSMREQPKLFAALADRART
jgi:hypothetical protein